MMMRSFENSCRKYFPRNGQRHGLDPIDAVMEGIVRVIESTKVQEWLDGSDEIRNIEGYLIRAVMTEQKRVALRYINKDKNEGRLAPEFYDHWRPKVDIDLRLTVEQIKEKLDDEERHVVWCLENGISLKETLELTGLSKHRYYQLRQQMKEKLS